MASGKKPNTTTVAEQIAAPIIEQMGLQLWDVRFEKEGSTWYLRYFIDKDGGVDINDCEQFSRTIDKLLDAADPIDQSYCLEVSSPGIERDLVKQSHFEQFMGSGISVKFIRPIEGEREFEGELSGYDNGEISMILDNDLEMTFNKSETAYVRLIDDYDYEGAKQ